MQSTQSTLPQLARGRLYVVMGVSGCGKTTLGRALAKEFASEFLDADDFHPASNVEKMRALTPLTDDDRAPWLVILNSEMKRRLSRGGSVVLACSALKRSYREAIASGIDRVDWVFLDGPFDVIAERIRVRSAATGHYMPADLLRSQFEALEPPTNAIAVTVGLPTAAQVECVRASIEP
jgi:carbohydrate kinase (thermoresistant glucokinase family)